MYLKSVENVITLGKLIGLLFLFCLPLLCILFLKTKRNDLARPVMGTIFLVDHRLITHLWLDETSDNWASEAMGCSIEISRDVGMYVCVYVCRMSNHRESHESNTRMLKVSIGR